MQIILRSGRIVLRRRRQRSRGFLHWITGIGNRKKNLPNFRKTGSSLLYHVRKRQIPLRRRDEGG